MMEMLSEFFQFDFMRRAFGAILVISPLLGILGTMIVHKRMAYFSDALGHSALTGIAIGVVMGVQDTSISMLIFAVVFALLLNQISRRALAATDTVISVFASCSTAIGLAILSMGGNFSRYSAILVGDILSITTREIFYLILIFAGTLVFWCVAVNLLNAVSVHPALARSRHLNVRLAEDVFAVVIALAFAMTGLLDQVVTFSIFSALMVYLMTCLMMYRFRKMYPVGKIKRSFIAPLVPLLPAVVAVIVVCGLFGLHLNYGINLISGAVFYFLASLWFLKRRAKFIAQEQLLEPGLKRWGKPEWM